ncbi:VOC family protein [Elongatibacter sediminis]|uniref:VOC family protein n=1 Tax=Elongatibacter sediminis TaxID=3119006 RepID=A0AAW9R9C5_9GAMM
MRYKAKSVEVICRWALVLSICLFTAQSAIAEEAKTTPPIKGQVTFLYYADMDKAAHFYGEIMGFENTFDEEWVKFFAITPTSSVGLVDESRGFHQTSDVKPVMLSVETDDVESWYNYLKKKDVNFIKHLDKSKSKGFVHAILVEDPGGYTVEVFEWK